MNCEDMFANFEWPLGVAGEMFENKSDDDEFIQPQPLFFKPYQSISNFFYKTATVVTAPIIYTAASAYLALRACYELLCAVTNTLKSLIGKSYGDVGFSKAAGSAGGAIVLIVLSVLSPAINLVDLIGSGIITAKSFVDEQACCTATLA